MPKEEKTVMERLITLEVKIDKEFYKKMLSLFELYTVKMGEMNTKLGELIGRLEEMDGKITKINAKIFN